MRVFRIGLPFAIFGFFLLMAVVAAGQQGGTTPPPRQAAPPGDTDLPRFARITDSFALGGQPTTAGIRKLTDMGFKSVVNLVSMKEGSMLEAKTVEFYGLKFFNVEVTAENINDTLVSDFIKIIEDKENQPLYIHCKTGNRIAAMLLLYRVKKEGRTFEAALQDIGKIGQMDETMREAVIKYLRKEKNN